MARKTQVVEFTTDIGPIVELYNEFGNQEASKLIGLTDISYIVRKGKARPAYVMAAQTVLDRKRPVVPVVPAPAEAPVAYIVKMSPEEKKFLLPIFEKLGVAFMSLDF